MYFSTLVAFAALPFLVGAIPVSPKTYRAKGPRTIPLTKHSVNYLNSRGHVDTRTVQAAVDQTEAKYHRSFDAYEKRTGETHRLALKRRPSNERRFTPTNFNVSNLFFTLDASIGTPPQSFSMQIDTLVPDTWISGVDCTTCSTNQPYDFTLSSSAMDMNKQVTTNQISGPVTGELVTDLVSAGGGTASVTFVVATAVDSFFQAPHFPGSGSVGVGFKGASSFGGQSWLDGLLADGALGNSDEVIGLSFNEGGPGPEFVLGGTDTSRIAGNLVYTRVVEGAIYWEIPLESVTVGGNDIQITTKTAVFDSGNTFVQGSKTDIFNLYGQIPGSQQDPTNAAQFLVPCNSDTSVDFTFNGEAYTVGPDAYILGPSSVGGGQLCVCGFVVTQLDFWIMGNIFLQATYLELDQKHFQVGLGHPV